MKPTYMFYGNGSNFIRIVARLLGPEFIREEHGQGVDFFHGKTHKKILSLVDDKEALVVRFFIPVPDFHRCTSEMVLEDEKIWEYRGTHLEDVVALIELALKNFERIRSAGDE